MVKEEKVPASIESTQVMSHSLKEILESAVRETQLSARALACGAYFAYFEEYGCPPEVTLESLYDYVERVMASTVYTLPSLSFLRQYCEDVIAQRADAA